MAETAVVDFIGSVSKLTDPDIVWASFSTFVKEYGFTHGGLADMPGPHERLEQTLFYLNWPEAWKQRYLDRNYVQHDPARLHLGTTCLPYTWEEMLASPRYKPQQRNIVFEAREFKLTNGLVIPFTNASGGQAMITVAGDHVDLTALARPSLHLAAIYVHTQIRALTGQRAIPKPILSQRERECLQWAAAGKSDWEIGEILSISSKTANMHLERSKVKFGVATRTQAIVAGVRDGYIHLA